jgi:AraC-like DNA-binding protein
VVKRWNVSGDELLAGSGLRAETLADPRALLSVPTVVALLERARLLTGEPAIGLHIGLQTRPTLYGSLGFALMSASSIREAIEISMRYGSLVTTAFTVRFRSGKRVASLIVDEHADFGGARAIVILSTLVALWQVSRTLTGRDLNATATAEIALPEPRYSARLTGSGLRMQFDRPVHQLTFDARYLDLPYTMPDPIAAKLAREQCDRELQVRGLNGGLPERVRGLIHDPGGGFRRIEEVAAAMRKSPRTLKRQLGAQGVRFSVLREEELRQEAVTLLRSPDLSLAEIATRLGYANTTSFERAFLRWTGSRPAKSRAESRETSRLH